MKNTLRLLAAARDNGLSLSGIWTLILLQEHGPLVISRLGERLAVTGAAMTGIIDGLETGGLVTRVHRAGDRRVWEIGLTDDGRAVVAGKTPTPAAR